MVWTAGGKSALDCRLPDVENNPSQASPAVSTENLSPIAAASEEQALLAQLRHVSELITAQQLAEAEAELAQAQKTSPRDLRVLKLLALVRFKLGHLAEARQVYLEACEVAPEDPTVRLNLGLIALKLELFSEAAVELESAVRLQPDDRRAWSYLGYAYARSSSPTQAATAFRRAGQHELAAEMERAAAPTTPADSAVVEGAAEGSTEGSAIMESEGGPSAVATPRPALGLETTPMPELAPDDGALLPSSLAGFTTARLLTLTAAPGPVEALGKGVLRFSAGAETHVRQSCLLAALGGQSLSLARRRERGHLSDAILADAHDGFFRVDGGGDLLLCSGDSARGLIALALDRDVLYLDESRVAAWGDEVVWESGTVPGAHKALLQFRGSGRVVVVANADEIVSVRLGEGERMAVPTARLVGWVGRIVVQGQLGGAADGVSPGLHHVTCEGEGVLLLARHVEHP
jgi:tetratricopeptide (TPR) repeat protein